MDSALPPQADAKAHYSIAPGRLGIARAAPDRSALYSGQASPDPRSRAHSSLLPELIFRNWRRPKRCSPDSESNRRVADRRFAPAPNFDRHFVATERDDCNCRQARGRSEEHTSELQSLRHLVCRLLLEKKKKKKKYNHTNQ